jgi:hypothetical protein
VLDFGLPIDWNIGIGIFPNFKEFFVRLPCGGFIAHHLLRAAKLQPSQGSSDMSNRKAAIVNHLLELSRGRPAIAELQIGETTDVGGLNKVERLRPGQIVLGSLAEKIDDSRRIVLLQLDRGPDRGGEVMLHGRVFGSFGADLFR